MKISEIIEELKGQKEETVAFHESFYIDKQDLIKVLDELNRKNWMVEAGIDRFNTCDSLLIAILDKNLS